MNTPIYKRHIKIYNNLKIFPQKLISKKGIGMWLEKARELGIYQDYDDLIKVNLLIEELSYLSKVMQEKEPKEAIKDFMINKISGEFNTSYNLPLNIAETILEGLKNKITNALKQKVVSIEEHSKYVLEHNIIIDRGAILNVQFKKIYKCILDNDNEYFMKVVYNPFDNFLRYEDNKPFFDYMFKLSASLLRSDFVSVVFLYNGVDIDIHRPDEKLLQETVKIYQTIVETLPNMESSPINAIQEAMEEYIKLHREYSNIIDKYNEFEKKKDKIRSVILELAKFAKIERFSYDKCKLYSYDVKYFNEIDFKKDNPTIYDKYLNKRKVYVVRYF